jgi:quercetin dioxygenase-like cupin family protein
MALKSVISHLAVAALGAFATCIVVDRHDALLTSTAQAQAQPQGQRSTELFNQVMDDVLGRRLSVRLTEREPGNGSPAHRHPGSHTVGYILEGTYEVKIDDGPMRQLKAGDVFYEPPNALHAVSRNASTSTPVKYLVIQVSDATKPATVVEK